MPTFVPGTDPVCGMTVDPRTASDTLRIDGVDYYFCSPVCAATFNEHAGGQTSH